MVWSWPGYVEEGHCDTCGKQKLDMSYYERRWYHAPKKWKNDLRYGLTPANGFSLVVLPLPSEKDSPFLYFFTHALIGDVLDIPNTSAKHLYISFSLAHTSVPLSI
jgi:hypothetical protein